MKMDVTKWSSFSCELFIDLVSCEIMCEQRSEISISCNNFAFTRIVFVFSLLFAPKQNIEGKKKDNKWKGEEHVASIPKNSSWYSIQTDNFMNTNHNIYYVRTSCMRSLIFFIFVFHPSIIFLLSFLFLSRSFITISSASFPVVEVCGERKSCRPAELHAAERKWKRIMYEKKKCCIFLYDACAITVTRRQFFLFYFVLIFFFCLVSLHCRCHLRCYSVPFLSLFVFGLYNVRFFAFCVLSLFSSLALLLV